MEGIDGQGRLTALQRLKMPVEYIVAEGAGNKECIYMNMNMVNWKLPDFIKSYAEQGNENYQRLLGLMEKYANGNLDIISTAVYRVSKSKHRDIKQGILQLTEEQAKAAIPRLEYIKPILEKIDEKKLPGSIVTLMQTLIYYFDYPEVDKERLAYSVEKYIYNATPWVLNTDCEREVENCYNYGLGLEKKIAPELRLIGLILYSGITYSISQTLTSSYNDRPEFSEIINKDPVLRERFLKTATEIQLEQAQPQVSKLYSSVKELFKEEKDTNASMKNFMTRLDNSDIQVNELDL